MRRERQQHCKPRGAVSDTPRPFWKSDQLCIFERVCTGSAAACPAVLFSERPADRFFLIDNVNISVRSAIAREIVSNILVHRDFGSAFPAKLIIERDKIYTENWNRTQHIGKLELDDFTPYPKNPILPKFFVNIGYADGLGSGVRNLYKFTKIYSGGELDLEEGDVSLWDAFQ